MTEPDLATRADVTRSDGAESRLIGAGPVHSPNLPAMRSAFKSKYYKMLCENHPAMRPRRRQSENIMIWGTVGSSTAKMSSRLKALQYGFPVASFSATSPK